MSITTISGRTTNFRQNTFLTDTGEGQINVARFEDDDITSRIVGVDGSTWKVMPRSSPTVHVDSEIFTDALLDLYDVKRIAEEEGVTIPVDETIAYTERVLTLLYRTSPRPYSVYPMLGGDIGIDAHTLPETKVTVICDPAQTIHCLTYIDDTLDQRTYDSVGDFLDEFVVNALRDTNP